MEEMDECAIFSDILKTPVGTLKVSCCREGVHSVEFLKEEVVTPLPQDTIIKKVESDTQILCEVICWLELYFVSPQKAKTLPPVCPSLWSLKGEFTKHVWQALMSKVPPGKTISYGKLATISGHFRAHRAVGGEMKRNPIPIIIPCHRVVKADGSFGEYSGGSGTSVKKWLLKHETKNST